jgi:hypothetical protein
VFPVRYGQTYKAYLLSHFMGNATALIVKTADSSEMLVNFHDSTCHLVTGGNNLDFPNCSLPFSDNVCVID